MRVLMTTDAVTGVWPYAVELVRALRGAGVHVTLACLGPPPRAHHCDALAALGEVELELYPSGLAWTHGGDEELARAGEWLLALEQRCTPDVVHLNGFAHAALAWRAPTLLVAHACVPSWWRAVHGESAPASYDGYRARVRAGLRRAEAVVAPSAWMLRQLLEYRVRFQAAVIPHARRATEFTPGPKCGLILAAGTRGDRGRNLAALEAVAGSLPWPVLVGEDAHAPVGPLPGPSPAPLGRWRWPLGKPPSPPATAELGPLSTAEFGWWMAHAAIFVHPARYEPFGLAPLEAGLSGCALVLGGIPSLREQWGDAAVYVSPDDRPGLARAIRALIDDPSRRRQLGERARLRAQRCTVARMLAGYHALYRELIRLRAHPAASRAARPTAPPPATYSTVMQAKRPFSFSGMVTLACER